MRTGFLPDFEEQNILDPVLTLYGIDPPFSKTPSLLNAMTYFPNHLRKRPLAALAAALTPVKNALTRDFSSDRLLFKPPALINPRVELELLPIKSLSVTQRLERQ